MPRCHANFTRLWRPLPPTRIRQLAEHMFKRAKGDKSHMLTKSNGFLALPQRSRDQVLEVNRLESGRAYGTVCHSHRPRQGHLCRERTRTRRNGECISITLSFLTVTLLRRRSPTLYMMKHVLLCMFGGSWTMGPCFVPHGFRFRHMPRSTFVLVAGLDNR